jgi:hypothetical protein
MNLEVVYCKEQNLKVLVPRFCFPEGLVEFGLCGDSRMVYISQSISNSRQSELFYATNNLTINIAIHNTLEFNSFSWCDIY